MWLGCMKKMIFFRPIAEKPGWGIKSGKHYRNKKKHILMWLKIRFTEMKSLNALNLKAKRTQILH